MSKAMNDEAGNSHRSLAAEAEAMAMENGCPCSGQVFSHPSVSGRRKLSLEESKRHMELKFTIFLFVEKYQLFLKVYFHVYTHDK